MYVCINYLVKILNNKTTQLKQGFWGYFLLTAFSVFLCVCLPLASITALQTSVAALQEELSSKASLIKSIQNDMVQSKKELAAKEISVQRARDELNLAHTRMAQENERVTIQCNTNETEETKHYCLLFSFRICFWKTLSCRKADVKGFSH